MWVGQGIFGMGDKQLWGLGVLVWVKWSSGLWIFAFVNQTLLFPQPKSV